jgi:hypothetical protein
MSTASLFTPVPHPPTVGRVGAYQLALTLRGAWPFVPFPASGDVPTIRRHAGADVTDAAADATGAAPAVTDAAQLALELA